MNLTPRQQQTALLTAAAVGAALVAQAWRRRQAYDFAGRTVIVTGGSRGLGLVLARQLAEAGASLALVARDQDELARAVVDVTERYPSAQVLPIVGDVRKRDDCQRAVLLAFERFGSVDVVINNAGIIQVGPLEHMQLADFDDAMNTHFWGPLYMIMAALPHMQRQGEGRIVNISSIGGRIAVPHMVPYSASKFALVGLSDGLRAELAHENITVTTVCPGLMRTGSPVNAMFKGRRPQEYAWFAISDSLPLASIDVDRAARQIVDACRRGDAELVITVQARMAILARTVAPELFSDVMSLLNRLLPAPAPVGGDVAKPGREAESEWAGPGTLLAAPTYEAARKNNEL